MGLRSLSIAASGGAAMQRQIDTIANNLANVNTTAFKRQRADFADLFYQQLSQAGFAAQADNQTTNGIQQGTGVRLVASPKMFTQGALDTTDRMLDWAIEGEGFFQVQVGGVVKYTRAGDLHRDSQGQIVTAQGFPLSQGITIPENITDIQVSPGGLIQGLDPTDPTTAQDFGTLILARFSNPAGMKPVGENLFESTPAAGNPITGEPGTNGIGILRDRTLEESNVNVIQELVDLIEAQRAFEMNTKIIETSDEILQNVNNLKR